MAVSAEFDVTEVRELIISLETVGIEAFRRLRDLTRDSSHDLRDLWRANAAESAGSHGKLYPRSITDSAVGGIGMVWEIGPDRSRRQGGMGRGFEYGAPSVIRSPNPKHGWWRAADGWHPGGFAGQRVGQTKPHLDGNRAADKMFPLFERRVAITAEDVFRGL